MGAKAREEYFASTRACAVGEGGSPLQTVPVLTSNPRPHCAHTCVSNASDGSAASVDRMGSTTGPSGSRRSCTVANTHDHAFTNAPPPNLQRHRASTHATSGLRGPHLVHGLHGEVHNGLYAVRILHSKTHACQRRMPARARTTGVYCTMMGQATRQFRSIHTRPCRELLWVFSRHIFYSFKQPHARLRRGSQQ